MELFEITGKHTRINDCHSTVIGKTSDFETMRYVIEIGAAAQKSREITFFESPLFCFGSVWATPLFCNLV